MALNFPDTPSNGDTYSFGGKTYTYNSTKSSWSPSMDLLVPTYATTNDLPSSGSAGSQAFVTATNRLYLWNGSGWYNIALINTTPSISGVSSSYALAPDGTATVITITATDPEGLPITYSIASDTSGNIATVTQGTGANTNVFTITPSTNTANAGSFSLTFRASDGVNIASSIASFTLQFIVENSNYTTALITSVGANLADNNDFVDSSTNSHTITVAGNATQTTFSPYRHGGYSVYCDGNDAVKFNETGSDEFTFGTGDFTLEGWFYIDLDSIGSGGEHTLIGNNGADFQLWFSVIGSNWGGPKYNLQTGTGSGWANTVSSGSNTVTLKEWVHLAVVRSSGTVTIYENGVSVASGSNSLNIPNSNNMLSFMGRPQTYGQYTTGYIHDVRITKGEAVYTSAFTPPTEKLTEGSNTKLLAFRKPYITDESSSSLSVTLDTGDPTTKPFAPYDYKPYSASTNGGSIAFDGTGDYLNIGNDASLSFDTGEFTIECWIYRTATAGTYQAIISALDESGTGTHMGFFAHSSNNTISFYSSNSNLYTTSNTISSNTWHHICATRNSSNVLKIYIDGTEGYSATVTDSFTTGANGFNVGQDLSSGNGAFAGCIADVRLVKGTVVYTSAFTPPTAPLTAITNTSLLLSGTNAGIIDKSQSSSKLAIYGSTKSSTTQAKYLTSSIYLNGTTDYIHEPDFNGLGTGDWTIEAWAYYDNTQNAMALVQGIPHTTLVISLNRTGVGDTHVYFGNGSSWLGLPSISSSSNLSFDTWNHVAVVRYNGTATLYHNGTSVGSTSQSPSGFSGGLLSGALYGYTSERYKGYISDLRITKGLARYTANFTPPTAELKG